MTGREALEAARAFIAPFAEPEETYGFFPGGDYDPRAFTPDSENTDEEKAAHAAACKAWDRGERPKLKRSGRAEHVSLPAAPDGAGGMTDPIDGIAIVCGSSFGMGVYEIVDRAAVEALAKIDAALQELP